MEESYKIREAKKYTVNSDDYWTIQSWFHRHEDAKRYPSYEECSRVDSDTTDFIEVEPEDKKETPSMDDDKKITAKLDAIRALVGVTKKVEEPDYTLLYAKFMHNLKDIKGLFCLSYEKDYPNSVYTYYLESKEDLWNLISKEECLAYIMYSLDWEVKHEKERHLIDELLRKKATL